MNTYRSKIFPQHVSNQFLFISQGRDYEPVYVTHKYTEQEKETLTSYESCDYLPNHSQIYKHWLKRQQISKLVSKFMLFCIF